MSKPLTDAAHSLRVKTYVTRLIEERGPISFRDYMDAILYAPHLGYYVSGTHKLGKGGDFVTAPEITSAFGQCLAAFMAPHLATLPVIMELGAGSGTLAADVLLALKAANRLPEAYWILELSPELKQRQQDYLRAHSPFFYPKITWLKALPAHPVDVFLLANEVLDAMPVNRFVMTKDGVRELGVTLDKGAFCWCELGSVVVDLPLAVPIGYRFEMNVTLAPFFKALGDSLQKAALLFIDYGDDNQAYYNPYRTDGTLQCYHQHVLDSDPFALPGLKDLTADVNFTQVAQAASAAGFHVDGYTTQSEFLIACGIEKYADADIVSRSQIKRLLDPRLMGEKFKVMCLSHNRPSLYPPTFPNRQERL